MKYFIPEWDDRVDPKYDFLSDRHSPEHVKDPFSDHYMWELFGMENVPFDGVLVSRAKIDENKVKKGKIQELGIHEFLRLPKTFPIIGDCGAFGYINEKVPPYNPIETLQFYKNMGVNFGVSVDHLVVKQYELDKDLRMQITFDNGLRSYYHWEKKYHNDFELLCAVQGWNVSDYVSMFKKYKEHGVLAFAFGGLARRPTSFVLDLVAELCKDIEKSKDVPDKFHFFGLARLPLFKAFSELEDKGVEVTFDSASFLRRAWLSAQNNYFTLDGKAYSAIRIPQTGRRSGLRGKNKTNSEVDEKQLAKIESECLSRMRLYAKNKTSINSVMESLEKYEKALGRNRFQQLKNHYLDTLKDRPWERCECPICANIGVEVIIFRGNNRNRRRGFHNVWLFYQMLKNPDYWPKALSAKEQVIPEIDLATLKKADRVLVITSCTKEKMGYDKNTKALARDVYKGRLFETVKRFCHTKQFDYVIISAKYGLLFPEEEIEGYEKMLRTKKDIQEIRPKVQARLKDVIEKYDKIVLIAGSKYAKVLDGITDHRFFRVKSRGYGDLCSKIKKACNVSMTRKIDDFLAIKEKNEEKT